MGLLYMPKLWVDSQFGHSPRGLAPEADFHPLSTSQCDPVNFPLPIPLQQKLPGKYSRVISLEKKNPLLIRGGNKSFNQ